MLKILGSFNALNFARWLALDKVPALPLQSRVPAGHVNSIAHKMYFPAALSGDILVRWLICLSAGNILLYGDGEKRGTATYYLSLKIMVNFFKKKTFRLDKLVVL